MESGNIILAALPQSNGKTKLRPALVLKKTPMFDDLLVCGISSQISQQVPGFDDLIKTNDDDFVLSGLVQPSLIRLGFLAIVPNVIVAGTIGKISSNRLRSIKQKLSDFILSD
ncbi:MAG: type II toxin-antitoxin system PemK/MazF family toxin [Bacteroidia bacterium]